MTSKSLFFKRIKQDLHQRIWFPVILFIIAFLVMELPLVSELDRLGNKLNIIEQRKEYLIEFFTIVNPFTVITCVAAVICAMSGFSYMHSARKLDMYHSMPVKREMLFGQQYVYGVIYFLIPMVIHVLACLGVGVVMGAFSVDALCNMAWFILIQTVLYLLFYSVSIAAVCLTGNVIINVLGCCVLLAYSWILFGLKTALYDTFFDTYFYNQTGNIWAFSPIHLIANMISDADYMDEEIFVYSKYTIHYVKMLIQAAVYTLAALWLYKKRPTEAAGKSIAFGFIEPVIKTMVMFPVAVVSAYLFNNIITDDGRYGWYVFGGIFGFLLTCLVMEAIFRQNPREVFKHPKHLVVNGVIVAAVFIIFRFDVFGYDYYMPVNVKSYAISVYNMNDIHMQENYRLWCLDHMELVPDESISKLVEQAIEDSDSVRNIYHIDQRSTDEVFYSNMYVKYQLDNGDEVYRSYLLNLSNDTTQQLLEEVYDSVEYKLGAYPILVEGWKKQYNQIEVTSAYAEDSFELSDEKMKKLIETYQRELKALTYDELWEESPVAELGFRVKTNDYYKYDYQSNYKIYDSFTQTIALLEEYGCIMESVLPVEQILSIEIEDWSVENSDTNGEFDKVMRVVYTQDDAEKLGEIMENVVSSSLSNSFNPDMHGGAVNVEIKFMLNEKEYVRDFDFKTGCMPDWLREELNQSLTEMGMYVDEEITIALPEYK